MDNEQRVELMRISMEAATVVILEYLKMLSKEEQDSFNTEVIANDAIKIYRKLLEEVS